MYRIDPSRWEASGTASDKLAYLEGVILQQTRSNNGKCFIVHFDNFLDEDVDELRGMMPRLVNTLNSCDACHYYKESQADGGRPAIVVDTRGALDANNLRTV